MEFEARFGYGAMVKDDYSGFTGKVVAVCFYKTGCTQYCVHPGKLKEDGTILSGEWLDETRLDLVEEEEIGVEPDKELDHATKPLGGPQLNPPAPD